MVATVATVDWQWQILIVLTDLLEVADTTDVLVSHCESLARVWASDTGQELLRGALIELVEKVVHRCAQRVPPALDALCARMIADGVALCQASAAGTLHTQVRHLQWSGGREGGRAEKID
jgi:hypothetical protein